MRRKCVYIIYNDFKTFTYKPHFTDSNIDIVLHFTYIKKLCYFTYFQELHVPLCVLVIFVSECKQATMLDLAFILDFDNLTPLDVIKVSTFIKSLLDHFSLSADATNVALVTKKLHPTVAWYFNSQAATGLTFQMSLPVNTSTFVRNV